MFRSIDRRISFSLKDICRGRYKRISIKAAIFFIPTLFLVLAGGRVLSAEDVETAVFAQASADIDAPVQLSSDIVDVQNEPFVLPEIYGVSINMLSQNEKEKKDRITAELTELIRQGKEKDAAVKLGGYFGRERKNSQAYLGFYCRKALSGVKGDMNERIRFLSWFLIGYGKNGVAVVSADGVESLSASGRRRGEPWKNVEEGNVPSGKLDRIYRSPEAVYIPFSSGEIFIIDIVGSDNGEVSVWKVLPGSVNKKSWPGGQWEREVTVRGDKLN